MNLMRRTFKFCAVRYTHTLPTYQRDAGTVMMVYTDWQWH